ELHQLVLQVDDLIQPGAKQIAFPRCLRLLRSHPSPPLRRRNHDRRFEGIFKIKNASFRALKPQKPAISKPISSEKSTLAQCLGNCSRTTISAGKFFAFLGTLVVSASAFLEFLPRTHG